MKKVVFYIGCFITIVSCRKTDSVTHQVENINQVLTKITKTTHFSDFDYSEVINYEYNQAGKIIAEGNKTYYRDEQQRIVRILDPATITNRTDIQVHYSIVQPDKVSYTFCKLKDGSTDSVVYYHDDKGQLIKTMSYFSYSSGLGAYITVLSHYDVFKYDNNGNIIQLDNYNINNGQVIHCGAYIFRNYDNRVNPQYAIDEVRTIEFSWNVINSSINNFANCNDYYKHYEYRQDGRPRSCDVKQNGAEAFNLTFEYK